MHLERFGDEEGVRECAKKIAYKDVAGKENGEGSRKLSIIETEIFLQAFQPCVRQVSPVLTASDVA